jgi:hypothetical protein
MRRGRTAFPLLLAVLGIGAPAAPAIVRAQQVRISGVTSMQGVDLRPLVDDSVPITTVTGTGPYRTTADGRLVRCTTGAAFCHFRSSGARVLAAPVVQDLRAVAWGLGEGVSVHAHVRLREALGNDPVSWPRADDGFDALEAYAQLDRGAWRARLGRQWAASGLGVYNYDGGALEWRRGRARLEAFAGRSLVAGLNDPIAGGALGAIDDLPPDEHGRLYGLSGSWALPGRAALGATWQRVIRADDAALYSERAALDASARVVSLAIDGALTLDLSAREVNEARLRVARPLPWRLLGSVELRRHRPFFEAWTIWGAFSPVAYDEARGTIAWQSTDGRLTLGARGGRRDYEETGEGFAATPLRGDGWRAGAGAEWTAGEQWAWYADYDIDIGFGASRSDVVVGGRWMPDERNSLGVALSGLQNIYEFRVGTGRVTGILVEGATQLRPDVRLVAHGALYAHRVTDATPSADWSQRRFSVRLEWTLGRDPGEVPAAGRLP